jgi:hypothetical protein
MRDDARAHDSAELTGVDCGDWGLVGGLSEVGQRQIAGGYLVVVVMLMAKQRDLNSWPFHLLALGVLRLVLL